MRRYPVVALVLIPALLRIPPASAGAVTADAAVPALLPVREVTVFKDGHAFVVREGEVAVGRTGTSAGPGEVALDDLPAPVLGTFWPYVRGGADWLQSVTADRRRVRIERTALTTRELIEANPGAEVRLTDVDKVTFAGTLVGVPERSAAELEATAPPGGGDRLPERGSVVLLKTADGVLSLGLDQVRHLTFTGPHRTSLAGEELRPLLTLRLAPAAGEAGRAAVGLAYLQKGLGWQPSYRVAIDGQGGARVTLQATLVNDLADLDDVTAHLVVGVPSFAFRGQLDPMALAQALAPLGQRLEPGSTTGFALSNAIMTQVAGSSGRAGAADEAAGPEVGGGEQAEDLFVFTVRHLSLRKGARLVLKVADYALKYRDVFQVELPWAPPAELTASLGEPQQAEIARLLAGPKARHRLRLSNGGEHPLTTAPALVLSGDRVLAQGLMTYTPRGADTDLDLTTAVDLRVKLADSETGRVANALAQGSTRYGRVDLAGRVTIDSRRAAPADLEVTRYLLGHVGQADGGGVAEMLGPFEAAGGGPPIPAWWSWIPWPGWWRSVNGSGRITWKLRIVPGQSRTLGYTWHYFWP